MRLLLITHDDVLARAYQARLARCGHEVARASTGYQGLGLARHGAAPDLIVLDVAMPGLHGLDVLKMLRDVPKLVRVPVIALIEHTLSQETVDQCLLWGADGVLPKDQCTVDEIVDRVRSVLQARDAAPEPA